MIEGRDFLRAFEYLEGMADEVGDRTQTGRAYYAAFLEARTFCETHLGYIVRKSGREHGEIPQVLTTLDSRSADNLVFLRRLRNVADYDLNVSAVTIAEQASWSGTIARSIIERLDELTDTSDDDSPVTPISDDA
jgi:hypothetical protein